MKTLKKITAAAIAAAVAVSLAACGENNEPVTESSAVTDFSPDFSAATTLNADVTADTEATTETTEVTEPEEDLTIIPDQYEFLTSVNEKLNAAESFEMTCSVKGYVPDSSTEIGKMIEHNFTYTVMPDVTHLESSSKDLNVDGSDSKYEEYQTLADNIVTTLTKDGGNWVNNTPKEMIRYNMTKKAVYSVALMGILADDAQIASDTFINADITRDEHGNYIFTINNWGDLEFYTDSFQFHGFSGLIRSPEMKDYLYDLSLLNLDGGAVYVFDKDFNLTSITFDIVAHDSNYDIHGELNFAKWNKIGNINTPRLTKASDNETVTETSQTNETATVSETTDNTETQTDITSETVSE